MFPLDPKSRDTDGDGVGNNADADDDGDGVSDSEDSTPLGDDFVSLLNGDGVPQAVADLLSGGIDSHTFAMTIESSPGRTQHGCWLWPAGIELYQTAPTSASIGPTLIKVSGPGRGDIGPATQR